MADRLGCCVPFCRRTIKCDRSGNYEWICGKHWLPISPTLRRRKYRLFRLYKRMFGDDGYWAYPAGSPKRLEAVKLDRLCAKAWDRCKAVAIERAAGI